MRGGRRAGAGRKPGSKQIATQAQREDFAAALKGLLPEAVTILAEIMRSTAAPESARLMAVDKIFDRAIGKPPQALLHQGADGGPVQVNFGPAEAALCYGGKAKETLDTD